VSSRDIEPESEAADLDSGEEGCGVFGVTRGDTTPSFEMKKSVFNQMAKCIEVFIIRPPVRSVFLRRDHGVHALRCGLSKNNIGIVSFVRNQMTGVNSFDQAACLRAIRAGTFCNNNSDRQTKRIHGQMYVGGEPPIVRLIS